MARRGGDAFASGIDTALIDTDTSTAKCPTAVPSCRIAACCESARELDEAASELYTLKSSVGDIRFVERHFKSVRQENRNKSPRLGPLQLLKDKAFST